jgi:hypothetical protein
MRMVVQCPQCSAQVSANGAPWCSHCGADLKKPEAVGKASSAIVAAPLIPRAPERLAATPIAQCPRCLSQLSIAGAPWCSHCGADLKKSDRVGEGSAAIVASPLTPRVTSATLERGPSMNMGFLGAYLVFFLGLAGTVVGGISFVVRPAAAAPPPDGFAFSATLLGITLCTVGSYLLARAEQVTTANMPGGFVFFLMTPLPALLAVGINLLGNTLRRSPGSSLPVLLIGLSVFCFGQAASWIWDGSLRDSQSFRGIGGLLLIDLGLAAVVLAIVNLSATAPEQSESLSPDE